MLGLGWKKNFYHPEAPAVFRMACGTLLLIYVSFWFTAKDPLAHIYYITIPVIIVFSFYVWGRLALEPRWRVFGQVCLAASFLFQWGFMFHMIPKRSLYTNRPHWPSRPSRKRIIKYWGSDGREASIRGNYEF